jgi:hypothetical protein
MTRGRYAFRTFPLALISSIALAFSLFSPASAPATTQSFATDLAGKQIDPLKSSPGKIVILIFVRTDCPISNRYAPAIQRLSTQYAQNASFFLVYPARTESPAQIRTHEKEFNYELPALRDVNHALVKQSHATITPEAAVFDNNHRLIYHGRIDDLYQDLGRARPVPTTHELDDAIRAAISGKPLAIDSAPAVGCYISDLE